MSIVNLKFQISKFWHLTFELNISNLKLKFQNWFVWSFKFRFQISNLKLWNFKIKFEISNSGFWNFNFKFEISSSEFWNSNLNLKFQIWIWECMMAGTQEPLLGRIRSSQVTLMRKMISHWHFSDACCRLPAQTLVLF